MRIGIIFGGKSSEYEVSLMSAASVMKETDREKYEPVYIGITKAGKWLRYSGTPEELEALGKLGPAGNSERWTEKAEEIEIGHLSELIDFAFIMIHGAFGEDGRLQGLFETLGIPYSGSGVMASSVCMDKEISKRIFKSVGLNTPDYRVMRRIEGSLEEERFEEAYDFAEELGYPLYIKPANTGSSIGISRVSDSEGLIAAINEAAKYDSKILMEKEIPMARELELAVLGNKVLTTSVTGEIIPGNVFYDYEAKYSDNSGTKILIPAKLKQYELDESWRLAVLAYTFCGCKGFARVDTLLNPLTGEVYINEINTIPGFTKYSMFPMLFVESGFGSYSELIDRIIGLGLESFRERNEHSEKL